jgi:hypothetical protein
MQGLKLGLGLALTILGGGVVGGGGPGAGVDDLLLESTDHFLLEGGTDVLIIV